MTKSDDFSWRNGRIKNNDTLGKIVSIPLQEDTDKETSENLTYPVEQNGIIVDEFKEKVTKALSKELHKKK